MKNTEEAILKALSVLPESGFKGIYAVVRQLHPRVSPNTVRIRICDLVLQGRVVRTKRAHYTLPPEALQGLEGFRCIEPMPAVQEPDIFA